MAEEKENLENVDESQENEETQGVEQDEAENVQGQEEAESTNESQVEETSDDEIEELKSSLLRLQADFSNFRKRCDKEKSDYIKFANESLVSDMLPVLDNFNRAFDAAEAQGVNPELIEGFELIFKSLVGVLEDKGLKEIESDGEVFDPLFHQAVITEDSEEESGIVLETLQKGYMLNDRVIRPSMVKVSN